MGVDLEQIYRQHRQALFTLALSITGCRMTAEDAVQDAFMKLCTGPELTQPERAVGYVFRSVRNAAVDQCRRQRRESAELLVSPAVLTNSEAEGGWQGSPQEQLLAAERARALGEALQALDRNQREVVILRVYGGLTFATIAEVTGESGKTVESRYRRALVALDSKLKAYQ